MTEDKKSIFNKKGIFGATKSEGALTQPVEAIIEQEPIVNTTPNIKEKEIPMETENTYNDQNDTTTTIVNVVKEMQKGLKSLDDIKKVIPTPDKLKELLENTNFDDINKTIFTLSNTINETKRILQYKEMELDVLECYMSLQIRTNPLAYGLLDGKTTENSIKCVISNNLDVLLLRKIILNINYMLNGIVNISKVLQTKIKILNIPI